MTTPWEQVECFSSPESRPPEPCIAVVFGASGDLAHREIFPAFHELARLRLLAEPFSIVGFALADWSDDEFRRRMRDAVRSNVASFDETSWQKLERGMSFVRGDFESDPSRDYAKLREKIEEIGRDHDAPENVFFHLAAPPAFFATIAERLGEAGLAKSERGWRRIVIEKPFGHDLRSARTLDRRIRAVFDEEQIYRIDHFLGKETVQNILVVRFGNPSFEPIWNRNTIDHVQITAAEDIGISTRGKFYDATGVVRDMLQNHLLQLLCMVAIEPPVEYDGPSLRDETTKVLQATEVTPVDVERDCVFGQYGPGQIGGESVRGYREEANVRPDSRTPTYIACRLTLDNWRWSGTPFYLRTGKRMTRKLTEIAIRFKPTPHRMFPLERMPESELVFRLQPEEGILQTFTAKQPGPDLCVRSVRSSFLYTDAFGIDEPPPAYAWLLRAVMQGDQTLFARSDWIDRAWTIVEPLLRAEEERRHDFPDYEAGTVGPGAADRVLERHGRRWRSL